MSTPLINSFAEKSGKTRAEVERLYRKAKRRAAEEGKEDNYAYITGILKHMTGLTHAFESIATMIYESQDDVPMTELGVVDVKACADKCGMEATDFKASVLSLMEKHIDEVPDLSELEIFVVKKLMNDPKVEVNESVVLNEGLWEKIKNFIKGAKNAIKSIGIKPGRFYVYEYDSKLYREKKLNFFDATPFIFCVDTDIKGFFGVNMNYLPKNVRKATMEKLNSYYPDAFWHDKTINADWEEINSKIPTAKYVTKRYLRSRVKNADGLSQQEARDLAGFQVGKFVGTTQSKVNQNYKISAKAQRQKKYRDGWY